MVRPLAWVALCGAALAPAHGASAAPGDEVVVMASAPTATSVTIYRAPDDTFGADRMAADENLAGYALISETREVDLPAGPAVVRFPGVAAGMLAESVVISGLPGGVREKNLDAQLLSPRHLYAGWFGRPVTLRRTDATGAVRSERAVIRSAPDGAAVVETAQGFETVQCGPFADALAYPGVPPGLFATPTLSVATDAPAPVHARLQIAYLAWDYDWRADYVMTITPDMRHARLQAWVTLASADVTSFPATHAAVVAGRPDFSETRDRGEPDDTGEAGDAGELVFHCQASAPPAPIVAPPPPIALAKPMAAMDIVVSAARQKAVVRAVAAEVENLGDLKLYRLPLPTTVAARAQKQVALFEPRTVRLAVLHSAALDDLPDDLPGDRDNTVAARLLVRTRNRTDMGLGLALPAGHVRVLTDRGNAVGGVGALADTGPHALVVGQADLADRAVGDRVELAMGETPQVQVNRREVSRGPHSRLLSVMVTNANRFAITFVGTFRQTPPDAISAPSQPLMLEEGHREWRVQVPAHGRATLRYRIAEPG